MLCASRFQSVDPFNADFTVRQCNLNVSGTASETIKVKFKNPQARISKLVKIIY